VWLVYGMALHSPINPSFRGRKTAVLSILGFALMIAVLVAVQLLPLR
jgi:ABC-type transport system involved in cytochrome c biogenesis permease subunit